MSIENKYNNSKITNDIKITNYTEIKNSFNYSLIPKIEIDKSDISDSFNVSKILNERKCTNIMADKIINSFNNFSSKDNIITTSKLEQSFNGFYDYFLISKLLVENDVKNSFNFAVGSNFSLECSNIEGCFHLCTFGNLIIKCKNIKNSGSMLLNSLKIYCDDIEDSFSDINNGYFSIYINSKNIKNSFNYGIIRFLKDKTITINGNVENSFISKISGENVTIEINGDVNSSFNGDIGFLKNFKIIVKGSINNSFKNLEQYVEKG